MSEEKKGDKKWLYYLIGIICFIVVSVTTIMLLLQGNTTISGGGEVLTPESLTCKAEGLWYPFFSYDNSNNKSIKLNILLDDKGKLNTISLEYRLKYDSSELIDKSKAANHAALNLSFGNNSLSPDSFEARFSNMGDVMQLDMYAKVGEINGVTAQYFLINGTNDLKRDTLTKNYNNQGLNCARLNKQDRK